MNRAPPKADKPEHKHQDSPGDRKRRSPPDRSGATGGAGMHTPMRRRGGRRWPGASRGGARTRRRLILDGPGQFGAVRFFGARSFGTAGVLDPRESSILRGGGSPRRGGAGVRGASGRRRSSLRRAASGDGRFGSAGRGSGRRSRLGSGRAAATSTVAFGFILRGKVEPQCFFDGREGCVVGSFRSWISRHALASRPYSKQRRPLPGDTNPVSTNTIRWDKSKAQIAPNTLPPRLAAA